MIEILKWTFLILFLAALVYGFTTIQTFSEKMQGPNYQEGIGL